MPTEAQPTNTKRARGRSGCLNCRARRKKCDEKKPSCSRCTLLNDTCKWDEAFPFRSVGVNPGHPSMPHSHRKRDTSELHIIDASPEGSVKRRKTSYSRSLNQASTASDGASSPVADKNEFFDQQSSAVTVPPLVTQSSTFSEANLDERSFDDSGLEALDFLTSHTSNIDMLASAVQTGDISTWSPEGEYTAVSTIGDVTNFSSPDTHSIYYPNDQYRELHSTFRQHMVKIARDTALNRQLSPELTTVELNSSSANRAENRAFTNSVTKDVDRLKCDLVSPRRQLELWRNYLDEIAPWLDMLDHSRHFQSTIPLMARSAPHLHYSILALSARQIERRSAESTYTESLDLYQQAIQMIMPRLQDLETEVIAACVLLCTLEMMSSSPRGWARHLDGCAMLLEAAGINGAVGGVRQAIFWCFARMDLWGGYLGDTITKIPTNRWFISSGSMASAVSQFKNESSADTYANYAVFLCASVVNVISTQEMSQMRRRNDHSANVANLYSTRWKALYDLLEDWYTDRPEELLPLMSSPATTDDYQHPFPIVLYATSPGVTGNQMYHAAALLMLQQQPKNIRLPKAGRRTILWHARQICGIAASNADHSAWVNALQPLWMAGKVFSHPSEHRAILELLDRIEKETGFATEWRASDLKDYWGDGSD